VGVYSPKPFKGTLQVSLPVIIHPSPVLPLPLFVLMNQCFSEHAHSGLIAGACSVSLALGENGKERLIIRVEEKCREGGMREHNRNKGKKE